MILHWSRWSHANDLRNRFLLEEISLVDLEDKNAPRSKKNKPVIVDALWNPIDWSIIDYNQDHVVAVPLSVVSGVVADIMNGRENRKWNILLMSGIMGGAGPDDVHAHCLWGPGVVWNLHMMVHSGKNIPAEIAHILEHFEKKWVCIHETYPKEHNRMMAYVQIIPTLLQVQWVVHKTLPKTDPAYTGWKTPYPTLIEMFELNYFRREAIEKFNSLLKKSNGSGYTAFEELLKDIPEHWITPNCTRVRKWLETFKPIIHPLSTTEHDSPSIIRMVGIGRDKERLVH